jgi:hypothetical protein
VIRVPPAVHAALERPTRGTEVATLAGLALSSVIVLQCVFAMYAAPLSAWLLPVRQWLLALVGAGVLLRGVGQRQATQDALRRLVTLAHAVDDAMADHERRDGCFTPEAHAAGRERLGALARRVREALEEAAVEQDTALRTVVGPLDLHRVLVANEEGVIAPSSIHVPPCVREAMTTARVWSRRGAPACLAAWMGLRAASALVCVGVASLLFGLTTVELAVVGLLAVVWLLPQGPRSRWARLAVRRDPRLASIELCASVERYNGMLPERDDLATERILRRRALDAAVLLDDLGPLGSVGQRQWTEWASRHRRQLEDRAVGG